METAALPIAKSTQTAIRKVESYRAFCLARSNGLTITASARAAGVSRPCATDWERRRRHEEETRIEDSRTASALLSKTELAETLARGIKSTEPQYLAGMAKTYAVLMGMEAPSRTQVEVRQIPASVSAWLETIDAEPSVIDVTPEPPLLASAATKTPTAPEPKRIGESSSTPRSSDEGGA